MVRITDITDKAQKYLFPVDLEMIEKAYIFCASVHKGQVRLSGEPYLQHPLEVAGIMVDLNLDSAAIVTGLLHDTVEDTLVTLKEIEETFGDEVAFLVDGLTKIGKITFESREEQQAENFRKMILAMSSDIRVLLIKLADRIHNMRTLEFQPPKKQRFIARETLELYAPLANRLGINWMKTEMEDLSFKYLYPEEHLKLSRHVVKGKDKRKKYTEEVKNIIQKEMSSYGLKCKVEGRAKHFFGIFKKMEEQHITFDEVYDLTAFRIILDSNREKECYETLSVVHSLWKPVPGRFKDYIAMPKANNYQSLHTTVIGPYGERVEIQIRTMAMHEWAEKGIAAHWRYKEGIPPQEGEGEQLGKIRELLEVQQELKDPREFMKNLKLALFPDDVYVFTPRGDVKSFPKGATPIDFAYSIHTDVGNQCTGAKVNRSIVPLRYKLQNGDTVEIITKQGHHPSKDWLKYAATSRAISKIKDWIKIAERERSIELGKDILEKEFKKHNLKLKQVLKTDEFKKIYKDYSINTVDDLMAVIGYGKISAKHISHRFLPEEERKAIDVVSEKVKKRLKKPSVAGVSITGIDDVMVRFAKCCDPLPGDRIVGYISRGRGISVHTANCPMAQEIDPERLIDVRWSIKEKHAYPVHMRVNCGDKKGLLAEISSVISSKDININNAQIDTTPEKTATCDFEIEVNDLKQFKELVSELKKLKSVLSVERVRGTLLKPEKKRLH
ncbi:MAG: bifunctional (p)ppGpp synthetase/guanosine-3',5'-bis(diphosphate) 3'-pyrophosphohydrolase [Thermodesulfobacteriota bacterium]|nr:bifunctional (p)ppGpp synthetase/guanosine-3',5'-bis(diphosphate) 3'-pyrophosphohydrolase [Thermodesulfobacteriota bacterium]